MAGSSHPVTFVKLREFYMIIVSDGLGLSGALSGRIV